MDSYKSLLKDVLSSGEDHEDRTGVGTLSVFGRQWRHAMSDGFPLLTTKRVPLRWVAEELFWFLSGETNELRLREKGVDIWKEWATREQCEKFGRNEGELGPVYGSLWRNFGGYERPESGVDQISELINDLATNPNSRRLIVTGWHPRDQRRVALPPCHTLWQLKVHGDNSISLHLYARSIDIFLGLPFNIASYALLLKLIAHATNRMSRDLVISFGDLHLYKNHREAAQELLSRDPRPLPTIDISEDLLGGGLNAILNCSWKHLTLNGYDPHGKIDATVAV